MKRAVIVLSAAVMMCSSPIGVYAEQMSAQEQTGYSIGTLSAPKVTKCKKYKNAVTLKWNKVKGATGYKVYKKVGKKYKVVGTVKGGSRVRFKVKGLLSGKKYSFKVRAYKKSGKKLTWSKYSAPKSVTTKADYSLFEPSLIEGASEYGTPNPNVAFYHLIDADGDGVKELFVCPATQYGNGKLIVYNYNYGDPKRIGECSTGLMKNGKKFYTMYAHQGNYSIWRLYVTRNSVKEKDYDSGYTEKEYPYPGKFVKEYEYNDRSPLK